MSVDRAALGAHPVEEAGDGGVLVVVVDLKDRAAPHLPHHLHHAAPPVCESDHGLTRPPECHSACLS